MDKSLWVNDNGGAHVSAPQAPTVRSEQAPPPPVLCTVNSFEPKPAPKGPSPVQSVAGSFSKLTTYAFIQKEHEE